MAAFLIPGAVTGIPRKERQFRGRDALRELGDEERGRFRFGRDGINFLSNLLKNDLERDTERNHALSVETQIMLALRFFASGSFLQVIGDTMGFDKSTFSRCVTSVANALVNKSGEFIKWPHTDSERNNIKAGFYQMGGFPNVIGCIDGTHVRIQTPSEHEYAYVNRKSYHSINVQAVADHHGRFLNINACWPGSSHDSHVFRASKVRTHMESVGNFDYGVLLGDSGYPCRPFVLAPYGRCRNSTQRSYSSHLNCTRSCVERTVGRWKRRFHVL